MFFALALPVLLAAAPTSASLRKAYQRNAHTLVEVSGGRQSGTGVIVGAQGQVATSVDHVGLYEAKVRVDGLELPAKVVAANARLKIAVVEVQLPEGKTLQSPAVRVGAPLAKGTWLVGIGRARRKGQAPKPRAGTVISPRTLQHPFVVTTLALPPGSPLFDTHGRLVAVVVERVGKIGSKAVPLDAFQAQIAQEAAP